MDERNELPAAEQNVSEEAQSALSQFIGTAKEVVERYNHCGICGGNLSFSHLTDFGKNLTQETARCPECGIRVRHMIHKLQ